MSFFNGLLWLSLSFLTVFGQPEVVITQGKLRGATKTEKGQEYVEYLGIPYAKPPLGDLRFKKPQPADGWEGTRDATGYGYSCWQPVGLMSEVEEFLTPRGEKDKAAERSEDCLTLNIYSPAKKSNDLRAVMVYIHGGGFVWGAGWNAHGWRLAVHGDVIVVTINYRLGIFGFLSTGDNFAPGNFGLLDQLFALQWVQDNIEAFGGDKTKVTIFGESAGGASVSYLSISPKSRGLFQRAIPQSGNAFCNWAFVAKSSFAWNAAQQVAKSLECSDSSTSESIVSCLASAEAESMFNLSMEIIMTPSDTGYNAYAPIQDGDVLPLPPKDTMRDRSGEGYQMYNDLDIMTGITNADGAVLYFFMENATDEGLTREAAVNRTKLMGRSLSTSNTDVIAEAIEDMYFRKTSNPTDIARKWIDALTDNSFTVPTVDLLNQHTGKGKSYLYFFTHVPSLHLLPYSHPDWFDASNHADELCFLFGVEMCDLHMNETYSSYTSEEHEFVKTFMTYWTNFAKTGNPGGSWPEYSTKGKEYMDISLNPTPKANLFPERMEFWLKKIPKMIKEKPREEL